MKKTPAQKPIPIKIRTTLGIVGMMLTVLSGIVIGKVLLLVRV